MRPPTEDALRYAATVLGRDVTQLERLVERELAGPPRDQLAKMLAHVRSVRTWILGVQMPIAQRRERRSSMFDDHDIDCRCSECAAEPLSPRDLELLKTSVVGLIPRQK